MEEKEKWNSILKRERTGYSKVKRSSLLWVAISDTWGYGEGFPWAATDGHVGLQSSRGCCQCLWLILQLQKMWPHEYPGVAQNRLHPSLAAWTIESCPWALPSQHSEDGGVGKLVQSAWVRQSWPCHLCALWHRHKADATSSSQESCLRGHELWNTSSVLH